ncbi:MAG TPA: hypothetical protein VF619_03785, partial [Allosphingosinicella sp.]
MRFKSSVVVLIFITGLQQASAQQPQPNAQILAQAYVRCLVTDAVRLTGTAATDDEIYIHAT